VPVPQVVIVGRPNVGKSSIFNWLAGRRIAIVDPTSGVTRDRLTTLIEVGRDCFELTDTGGMGVEDRDQLTDQIEQQIQLAVDQADVILFIVDAIDGVAPLDREVAERLRGVRTPALLVVNKCDNERLGQGAAEFYGLGTRKMLPVSCVHNQGKNALLREIKRLVPPIAERDRPGETVMKLAIVGRRNVGKSTFINCLAEDDRVIVSEVPGTTRDSVDVHFQKDGKTFVAIDTAGVQRKSKVADSIEFYSLARSQRSIRRADVVLLFIDVTAGVTRVDLKLASYVESQAKPCVFVVNKWDLRGKITGEEVGEYIEEQFPSLNYVPIAFVTALAGKNVQSILDLSQALFKQALMRVGTGVLNRVIGKAIKDQAPAVSGRRRPKIYYSTQVATAPPTIVAFCNNPSSFTPPYRRYLLREMREALPFKEVPIRFYLRRRTESQAKADRETMQEEDAS